MSRTRKLIWAAAGVGLVTLLVMGGAALRPSPEADSSAQDAIAQGGPSGPPCGGFAGLECPSPRQVCIDDPRDNCDPRRGGADCIGICRGPGAGSSR